MSFKLKKTFNVGSSDFEEFAVQGDLLVDKTELIQHFIEGSYKVTLITRPRRWGKSLNLSMLKYFFSPCVDREGKEDLEKFNFKKEFFSRCKIGQFPELLENYLGKYPVVLFSFHWVNPKSYNKFEENINILVQEIYKKHLYLLKSPHLNEFDKNLMQNYLTGNMTQAQLERALVLLTGLLYQHFQKKVILLIDEYDHPFNQIFADSLFLKKIEGLTESDLNQMVNFLKSFLGGALKDSSSLHRGLVTGILRVLKTGIFSGMNNFGEVSLFDKEFASDFGFTEPEIENLLKTLGKTKEEAKEALLEARQWYNGYSIGGQTLYNPWSVMNWLGKEGELKTYWINTAYNGLIRSAIDSENYQSDIEDLLLGKSLRTQIRPNLSMEDFHQRMNLRSIFWTLLTSFGYLTLDQTKPPEEFWIYSLKIPNKEVRDHFKQSFIGWVSSKMEVSLKDYILFIKYLELGKLEKFEEKLKEYIQKAMSYYQRTSKRGELFYYRLILGLVAILSDDYWIEPERESEKERADLILIPKPESGKANAFVMEFKVAEEKEDLSQVTQKAFAQIKDRNYALKVKEHPQVKQIFEIAIGFSDQEVELLYQPTAS